MKKVKILHIISNLDTGGAELFLSRLVASSGKDRFEHVVVSMTDIGNVGQQILSAGIPVYALGMKKGMPDPMGVTRFLILIRRLRPNIVQCWMYHANLFGLMAKILAPGTKILWNIRCAVMEMDTYGIVYQMTVKAGALLSAVPDRIIVNSYAGQKAHVDFGYRHNKWEVIQNGVDSDIFKPDDAAGKTLRQKLGVPDSSFLIAYVARFDPVKNHENFFGAANILLKTNSDVHFILVGRGMDNKNEYINKRMASMALKGNFRFLGEQRDLNKVYNAADIIASTSNAEGFPNVIAEAMASGTPCVVTDAGDSKLIVGNTGIVVPVKDSEAQASAWKSLADASYEYLAAMGRMAGQRAKKQFSFYRVVKRYERIWLNTYS